MSREHLEWSTTQDERRAVTADRPVPDTLLEKSAPAYAALLEAVGVDDLQIAARLQIPVESVQTVLEVGRAKLGSPRLS